MHYYFFFAVDGSLGNLNSALSISKKIWMPLEWAAHVF